MQNNLFLVSQRLRESLRVRARCVCQECTGGSIHLRWARDRRVHTCAPHQCGLTDPFCVALSLCCFLLLNRGICCTMDRRWSACGGASEEWWLRVSRVERSCVCPAACLDRTSVHARGSTARSSPESLLRLCKLQLQFDSTLLKIHACFIIVYA
jgi:hypothetical protein